MIDRFEIALRKVRRWLSRNEWGIRLLGLTKSVGTEIAPGLVMIQIDGLSRKQLETALKKGRMPFLNHLLHKEGYHLQTLYSGLPASTPAVQGELFYGVKGAVPAFGFLDRKTGRVIRMFDNNPIAAIQKSLEERGEGLLRDGSSYTNIFSGGASELHFCPATLGWDHFIKAANPFALASIVAVHGISLLRTAASLIVEAVLATVDCIRGLIDGRDLWKELKFVPTRVAISILLRDLVAIGAMIDVTRGLPVVHVNFIGYDEQAHRRGPSSNFAHWSLKGIDDAIKRLTRAARGSSRRDYDIWIYSDHGQEEVTPYAVENGRTIQEAVENILTRFGPLRTIQERGRGEQFERSKWVGGSFLNWLVGEPGDKGYSDRSSPVVTAMGSLAHVYIPAPLDSNERDLIAGKLVNDANVPVVLAATQPGVVQAWTSSGKFHLPEDAEKILGTDHPFLAEATSDLIALCRHLDAGDLILSGWRQGKPSISFPMEHGSHTGPGYEETRAFALLPITAPVSRNEHDYLRPLDLREGALCAQGRHPRKPRYRRPRKDNIPLRIMTYNVHSCIGMDGKLSPARIAKVIAHYDPDIVALQELDEGRPRTGEVNQAHFIAQDLEMEFHFHPALQVAEELYGDAILSRYPMRLVHAGRLPGGQNETSAPPGLKTDGSRWPKYLAEPRGALWVAVMIGDREVQLLNTHFGLRRRERSNQVEALLGPQWLDHPDCRKPVILCGDFNALPGSPVCRKLRRNFRDAQLMLNDHRPQRTFFGRYPVGRIDHVFVSPEITVTGIEVPRTALTRVASDHLPLIVEVNIATETSIL